MKLHARQKYDYRDLERGEAQLIRVGHALWRDRRKLGDTVSEREGINAAIESVWQAKREYRAELAEKRALKFSEYRKGLPQRCVAAREPALLDLIATSVSWPTGDAPLSCRFVFNCSAHHRKNIQSP
jgi:hypothetical protein